MVQQHGEALVAHQRHVWRGQLPGLLHLRPTADHDELLVGHPGERLDDHRDALVRHHSRGRQVVILFRRVERELTCVDRWINHRGFAAVALVDAPTDEVRVGDKVVNTASGALIPHAHVVKQHARQFGLESMIETRFVQVLMLQIPGIADRRVHVADMQLVRAGQNALGYGMAAGNHQVVARHVQLLDGQRHQGQILLVVRLRLRQLLDESRGGALAAEVGAVLIGEEIDHGIQVGFRPDIQQSGKHPLGTGIGH